MIKDINKYLIMNLAYNIVIVIVSLELLRMCNNKKLEIVLIIYSFYKVIIEMYYIYRGIYIGKRYIADFESYDLEQLCVFCKNKYMYRENIYENIKSGTYSNCEKEMLISACEIGVDNYYNKKIYGVVYLAMNFLLIKYLGENAMNFCGVIAIRVIIDIIVYTKEKNDLDTIKQL